MRDEETIAAISTPVTTTGSGIGIVRISGPLSPDILRRLIRSPGGVPQFEHRRMVLGHLVDPESGEMVDEVLAVFMKAPKTYTRQDMAEIHCHGGAAILKKALHLVIKAGARPAEPGEFTKRAFLSGRIDLTRAEAVAEAIRAKSELALRVAARHMAGDIKKVADEAMQEMADLAARLELVIDFPDEEIEPITAQETRAALSALAGKLEEIASTHRPGRLLAEGAYIVIAGPPNAGKSSILNRLLARDRAIVTPLPGTTRDTIEEPLEIGGVPIRLVDTAGIGEAEHPADREGIKRAIRKLEEADLVLLVLDASRRLEENEPEKLRERLNGKMVIAAINKEDIRRFDHAPWVKKNIDARHIVRTSALTGQGLDELKDRMKQVLTAHLPDATGQVILTSERHARAFAACVEALKRAVAAIDSGAPWEELVATDLREAMDHLGSLTGAVTTEDVIKKIFDEFCVGK